MRSLRLGTLVLLLATSFGNIAGDWTPRTEAIKNLASGYALIVLCSAHGFADPIIAAKLGSAYEARMTKASYEDFRDQYQKSLSDRRIYSIAGKRWVSFQINAEECATVDRTAELYLQRLTPSAR